MIWRWNMKTYEFTMKNHNILQKCWLNYEQWWYKHETCVLALQEQTNLDIGFNVIPVVPHKAVAEVSKIGSL
jgi:hypothetical protein